MKTRTKILIVYVAMMFLSSGCAITPEEYERQNKILSNMRATGMNQIQVSRDFHCIGRESLPDCHK